MVGGRGYVYSISTCAGFGVAKGFDHGLGRLDNRLIRLSGAVGGGCFTIGPATLMSTNPEVFQATVRYDCCRTEQIDVEVSGSGTTFSHVNFNWGLCPIPRACVDTFDYGWGTPFTTVTNTRAATIRGTPDPVNCPAPPPADVRVQIDQIKDWLDTFSVDTTPAQTIRIWNDPITVRATATLPSGTSISSAEFVLNRQCQNIPQRYPATVSGSSFSAQVSTSLCLSAFEDLTLQAKLTYNISGQSAVASDTIQIEVVPLRVMVDPGHGGSDPGNIGPVRGPDGRPVTPLQEKDLTLEIGLGVRNLLANDAYTLVFMTRDMDEFIEINRRSSLSNQRYVDYFVSIHFNAASNPSVNGTETYYRTTGPTSAINNRSRDYATELVTRISYTVGAGNRGAKRSSESPRGRLGVLDDNIRPAALTESSFLSNPGEQERLRNSLYLHFLAADHKVATDVANQWRPRFRDQNNPRY
ncbi:MAG: N-acetylmuramoyl-L-alanine amidase [Candidatus Hadarchaeum sp.]